jgi:hypothetical protein
MRHARSYVSYKTSLHNVLRGERCCRQGYVMMMLGTHVTQTTSCELV